MYEHLISYCFGCGNISSNIVILNTGTINNTFCNDCVQMGVILENDSQHNIKLHTAHKNV